MPASSAASLSPAALAAVPLFSASFAVAGSKMRSFAAAVLDAVECEDSATFAMAVVADDLLALVVGNDALFVSNVVCENDARALAVVGSSEVLAKNGLDGGVVWTEVLLLRTVLALLEGGDELLVIHVCVLFGSDTGEEVLSDGVLVMNEVAGVDEMAGSSVVVGAALLVDVLDAVDVLKVLDVLPVDAVDELGVVSTELKVLPRELVVGVVNAELVLPLGVTVGEPVVVDAEPKIGSSTNNDVVVVNNVLVRVFGVVPLILAALVSVVVVLVEVVALAVLRVAVVAVVVGRQSRSMK